MKHKLLTIAMIIGGLTLPLEINAKGKPASVPLLKDANGETVGRVIGMEHVSRPYVLTGQGYRTNFSLPRGWIDVKEAWVYYDAADCEGKPYVATPKYVGTIFTPNLAMDAAYEVGKILYVPHDAQSVMVDIKSVYNTWDSENPICDPYVVTGEGYLAYPNDPTVTGIENTVYPTPMVIE